jgi:hypothetical protein
MIGAVAAARGPSRRARYLMMLLVPCSPPSAPARPCRASCGLQGSSFEQATFRLSARFQLTTRGGRAAAPFVQPHRQESTLPSVRLPTKAGGGDRYDGTMRRATLATIGMLAATAAAAQGEDPALLQQVQGIIAEAALSARRLPVWSTGSAAPGRTESTSQRAVRMGPAGL